jgi:multiple sugar transport system ATP-binding protein
LTRSPKAFGAVEVIPPLDLTIEDGEFVVFVGPSGCGKSTLLRLIAGLEDVTGGEIRIDGRTRPRCRRPSAAWPWCSSPTRFTRI